MSLNQKYMARWEFLDTQFQPFKEMFKLITQYVWPTAGNYLDYDNPSDQITSVYESIFDNTAELAVGTMAAGMMAGHMSPSLKWHRLTTEDPERAKSKSVKQWLDIAEDVMFGVYARSNLYEMAHRGFEEQSAFGTEVLFIEEDFLNVAKARIFTAGEYRIALGEDGAPDALYRQTQIGAAAMVEMFGKDKVSDAVRNAAENSPYKTFDVVHVIEPNMVRNPDGKGPKDMPYGDVWFEKGNREVQLRNKGFREQPFAATRFRVRGVWPYGIGPGMSAFGMTRVLQEMEKSSLVGTHRQVSPPLVGNARFKGQLNVNPDAINWSAGTEDPYLRPLYQLNFSIDKLEQKQAEIRRRISQNFYTDLFLMFSDAAASGRQVTATEVIEKASERRLQLGPMVERQSHEKLGPIVDRIFNLCLRRGLFPPIPDDLRGQPLKVEYVGLLAQAQKLVELQSINTYLGVLERCAALDQTVLERADLDKVLKESAEIIGVPASINRSDDEVEQVRALKNQALQREQDLQMENAELENIDKASQVDLEKLRELQGG